MKQDNTKREVVINVNEESLLKRRKAFGRVYGISLLFLIVGYLIFILLSILSIRHNSEGGSIILSIPILISIIVGCIIWRSKKPSKFLVVLLAGMSLLGFLIGISYSYGVYGSVLMLAIHIFISVGLLSLIESKGLGKSRATGEILIIMGILMMLSAYLSRLFFLYQGCILICNLG